jgi:hypothetical protein
MWSSFTTAKKDKKGKKSKAIVEEPVKVSVHTSLPCAHFSSSYSRAIYLDGSSYLSYSDLSMTILILLVGR